MLYVRKINLKNRNDSNVLLYEMTEAGSRVLDVGCACGDLSALLAERKNAVSDLKPIRKVLKFVENAGFSTKCCKLT